MAAAEIERFAAGRAAAATSRIGRRWRRRDAGRRDEPHAGDRSGDRQLPRGRVRRGRHAGRDRASASGRTPRCPALPGSQVFDTDAQLGAHLRLHPRGARRAPAIAPRDIAAVSSTSMREGMVLYDADGREIWACPNVDSRAAAEAAELVASGRRAAALRARRRLGVDHLARPLPLDPGARARDVRGAIAHVGMLSDWVALPADRPVRHRPIVGLQLEPVRPRARAPGRPSRSSWSACRPTVVPEVLEPGTVMGEVDRRAPPRRPAWPPGRRSSSAVPTRSSGWSASGSSGRDG